MNILSQVRVICHRQWKTFLKRKTKIFCHKSISCPKSKKLCHNFFLQKDVLEARMVLIAITIDNIVFEGSGQKNK